METNEFSFRSVHYSIIRFLSLRRHLLSLSMEARHEYEQAADIAATAVLLEADSPIVSYHSIVRVL